VGGKKKNSIVSLSNVYLFSYTEFSTYGSPFYFKSSVQPWSMKLFFLKRITVRTCLDREPVCSHNKFYLKQEMWELRCLFLTEINEYRKLNNFRLEIILTSQKESWDEKHYRNMCDFYHSGKFIDLFNQKYIYNISKTVKKVWNKMRTFWKDARPYLFLHKETTTDFISGDFSHTPI